MKNSSARVRTGFTFYRSFNDAIRLLNSRDQLALFHAIADYALDQRQPELDKLSKSARICWVTIRPNLDANLARYNNGCRPKTTAPTDSTASTASTDSTDSTACEAKQKQSRSKHEADSITDDNVNDHDNVNDKETCKRECVRSKFVIPTFEEVAEYIAANNLNVDGSQFIDYYTSNNWMVGRNKMRDWQAALRNWARRDTGTAAFSLSLKIADNEPQRPIYQAL